MGKRTKTTRWAPVLWQRTFRDVAIWVEQVYSVAPKWEWNVEWGGGGRSMTKLAAMRAAEKYIRAALTKGSDR
jgi:hypothetical protein